MAGCVSVCVRGGGREDEVEVVVTDFGVHVVNFRAGVPDQLQYHQQIVMPAECHTGTAAVRFI